MKVQINWRKTVDGSTIIDMDDLAEFQECMSEADEAGTPTDSAWLKDFLENGDPRDYIPWLVQVNIRSGIDNGRTVVGFEDVLVIADNEEDARRKAVALVTAESNLYDDRIDPLTEVVSSEMTAELGIDPDEITLGIQP